LQPSTSVRVKFKKDGGVAGGLEKERQICRSFTCSNVLGTGIAQQSEGRGQPAVG